MGYRLCMCGVALILMSSLTSCSSDEQLGTSGVGVSTHPGEPGGDSGLFSGTLVIRDNCLRFISSQPPDGDILPSFPGSVSITPDLRTLHWVGGDLQIGAITQLGGGIRDKPLSDVPQQCTTTTMTKYLVIAQP